jgi:hypothetical protein
MLTETQFLNRCERLGISLDPRQFFNGKVIPRRLTREELKSLGFVAAAASEEIQ